MTDSASDVVINYLRGWILGGKIRKQQIFGIFQLFTVALVVKHAVESVKIRNPYFIGDWLINYQGGFIRRGLPGEIIFWAAKAIHVQPAWFVFAVTVCFYLLFQIFVFRMTRTLHWTYALIALMVSPATLAFEYLNPAVGLRKEVLLFLTLSWIVSSTRIRHMNLGALSAVLTVASVVMVLSHESLLFYFPYIVAGLIVRFNDFRKALQAAVVPAIGTGLAAIEVVLHPGNHRIAAQVCSSIGGQLEPFGVFDGKPCSGAIVWLEETLPQAHALTWQYVRSFHFYRAYSVLAVLAFVPVLLLLRRIYARSSERLAFHAVVGSALASMLATVVLFYGAMDWGRWIHIHAVCLMLLLMSLFRDQEVRDKEEHTTPSIARPIGRRMMVAAMIFAYATLWTLPVTRTADTPILGGIWLRFSTKLAARAHSPESDPPANGGVTEGRLNP